jgi:hypothetical protein
MQTKYFLLSKPILSKYNFRKKEKLWQKNGFNLKNVKYGSLLE